MKFLKGFSIFGLCLFILLGTIYTFKPSLNTNLITVISPRNEHVLIKDWIKYKNYLKQANHPIDEVAIPKPDHPQFEHNIFISFQHQVKVNERCIELLNQSNFESDTYKNIRETEIKGLHVHNQLIHESIIEPYQQKQEMGSLIQEPYLKLNTQVRAARQKAEIEVLNQLKVFTHANNDALNDIEKEFLADWITLNLYEHQINPIDPVWNTQQILKDISQHSTNDDQKILEELEALNLKTQNYQIIQKLKVRSLRETLNLFSSFDNSPKDPIQDIKKLTKIMHQQDFKQAVDLSNFIYTEEQKLDDYVFQKIQKVILVE